MNRRTLSIFGGIFAVLLVITVVQNYLLTPQAEEIGFQRVFPELIETDIRAIRLSTLDEGLSFTLSRDANNEWTAPEISEGVLNLDAVTGLVQTVVVLPYWDTVTPQSADMSAYGFTPGVLLVAVVLTSGEQHGIVFGGLTPDGDRYYTIVDDRPELYLVERGAVDFLINYLLTPPIYLTTTTPGVNLTNDGA